MKNKTTLAVIDGKALTKQDFMQNIDNELIYLHDTGDFDHVTHVISALDALDNVSGHAKAKLLWGFGEWWKENRPDENFSDHIESTTGTKPITVKRYSLVQKYIENLDIPKEVAERPMRDLVPIALCISQGYDISKAQWRKIELAQSDGELRDVLRKIKGKEPRKNAKVIHLERDGTIVLWSRGVRKFIGYLNLDEAKKDEEISEVIEKIKAIGIIED